MQESKSDLFKGYAGIARPGRAVTNLVCYERSVGAIFALGGSLLQSMVTTLGCRAPCGGLQPAVSVWCGKQARQR
jgi:hypothetical protein